LGYRRLGARRPAENVRLESDSLQASSSSVVIVFVAVVCTSQRGFYIPAHGSILTGFARRYSDLTDNILKNLILPNYVKLEEKK
jgi:hypothetical protein